MAVSYYKSRGDKLEMDRATGVIVVEVLVLRPPFNSTNNAKSHKGVFDSMAEANAYRDKILKNATAKGYAAEVHIWDMLEKV